MRWLLIFLVACLIFNGLQGWLRRFGLGRLPGDFSFKLGGRTWFVLPRAPKLAGARYPPRGPSACGPAQPVPRLEA